MRFSYQFKRVVTAGPVLWTTDVLPVDGNGNHLPPKTKPSSNNALTDFFFDATAQDRVGFPSTNVAVAYQGPAGAADLVADLYVWDALTQHYYRLNNTAGQALKQGVVTLFPALALADAPINAANLDVARSGGTTYALIVTPSGTGVGNYFFALGNAV